MISSRYFTQCVLYLLGVTIEKDVKELIENGPRLIVSNHITQLDPLIVSMVVPCHCLTSKDLPWYIQPLIRWTNYKNTGTETFKVLSTLLTTQNDPVLCFPEPSITNGAGLMKFDTWPFSTRTVAHLIQIDYKSFLIKLNLCPSGSIDSVNLCCLFFLPMTTFRIRYISSVLPTQTDSIDVYAQKVQTELAQKAKLISTNVTEEDKERFLANKIDGQPRPKIRQQPPKTNNSMMEMARQVKDVLPQVPLSVIETDIKITKNIDDTIDRLLSGVVKFTSEESEIPVPVASNNEPKIIHRAVESPPKAATTLPNNSPSTSTESTKLFYCGAATFGKTARERVKSYDERKARLYQQARERFLQREGKKKTR